MGYLLTFLLCGIGIVSMHHAHRNLLGLSVHPLGTDPVFAGESALYRFRLHNSGRLDRHEVRLRLGAHISPPADVPGGGETIVAVSVPAAARGRLEFGTVTIESRHPVHLFRVWSWAHLNVSACIWPAPAPQAPAVPLASSIPGEAGAAGGSGEDDFSGLREFHRGDSPRRIAWKAFAHNGDLRIKQFSGSVDTPRWLDLARVPAGDLEARLGVLCRWALDSAADDQPFGLRLPGQSLAPSSGRGHLEHALTLMADFDGAHADGEE
jgi:uncharacterized protein (DUF58 family)